MMAQEKDETVHREGRDFGLYDHNIEFSAQYRLKGLFTIKGSHQNFKGSFL